MPDPGFMTVKSWIRTAAEQLNIHLSNREAHRVMNTFIAVLSDDKYRLLHADPTGEAAVREVMTWMRRKQSSSN